MPAKERADLTESVNKKSASKKATAKKKAVAKKTSTAKKVAKKKASGTKAAKTAANEDAIETTTAPASKKAVKKKVAKKKAAAKAEPKKLSTKPMTVSADIGDDSSDDGDAVETNSLTKAPVPYERGSGHYMDADQLSHFSKKLAEWKQQLMEEVDRTVGHMKDDATNFPDPNDRATQEEEFSLELRTRDRERKLIKKINEAQKRIDDDEYGYCETCGIEIGVNRLEARPTAELCIDCKTLEEIRERQTA